jgi:peptidoglycan/xylan/chitin deacetylase (PgdA/CDA1 family)
MTRLRVLATTLALALLVVPAPAPAQAPLQLVEPHHRLEPQAGAPQRLALTLDACSGRFDAGLIDFLVRERIPATLFLTRRWIRRNPQGVARIKAHLGLFQVENHGASHVPAVIGPGREVHGLAGVPDVEHLRAEVEGGARAIEAAFGVRPRWYRGATAVYDAQALREIGRLGYRIAGFSVNADGGATLPRAAIERRLRRVRDGDVIIAHMNKPDADTAEALEAALPELRRLGFVFVRLDQAALQPLPSARERLQ